MSCSLYRFFDSDDRLLYIGITTSAAARLAQHAGDKDWFPEVARASFEHFATRADALAAEKAAIVDEEPAHNVRHSTSPAAAIRRGEMTAEDVAAYVRVDVGDVTRWANFGRIPHKRRADGSLVFRRKTIDSWLRSLRNTEESA